MKFRNQRDHALGFELDGHRYDVEALASVEIPDRVAYAVALYGLPLAPEPPVEPVAEPVAEESSVAPEAEPTSKPSRKKN